MGWLVVLIYTTVLVVLPPLTFNLLFLGGLFYSFGVAFLLTDHLVPYFHVVWHLIVFAATVCMYMALLYYIPYAKERYDQGERDESPATWSLVAASVDEIFSGPSSIND